MFKLAVLWPREKKFEISYMWGGCSVSRAFVCIQCYKFVEQATHALYMQSKLNLAWVIYTKCMCDVLFSFPSDNPLVLNLSWTSYVAGKIKYVSFGLKYKATNSFFRLNNLLLNL